MIFFCVHRPVLFYNVVQFSGLISPKDSHAANDQHRKGQPKKFQLTGKGQRRRFSSQHGQAVGHDKQKINNKCKRKQNIAYQKILYSFHTVAG